MSISQFQRPNCGCLNGMEVCRSRGWWGRETVSGTLEYKEWKSHFPILEGLFLYFSSFFLDSVNFFQRLLVLSSCRDSCFLSDIEMCHLGLGVLAPWDIVKYKSYFSILWDYPLILVVSQGFLNFCERLFIFFGCWDWLYGYCLVFMCLTSCGVFWHLQV